MAELKMRPSRVLRKLRAGEVAIMAKLNTGDPRVAEIAAMAGFDCLWPCLEHVPNSIEAVERQIMVGKAYDVDTAVRVSRGGYSDYIRPLEMDAAGIIVPHIMSLADAQWVARTTRFHPIGRRPVDGGNADGAYCGIPFTEYLQQANEQRFVCIQIEDPEPLDELEAIVAVEGIDMIFFGPGDFSQGIGAPGQFDHPLIDQTRRRIAELCRKHGKYAATVGSPGNLQSLIDMGYTFINVCADVVGLFQYFHGIAGDVRKVLPEFGLEAETGGIYGK
ncbi:MAG: HpcH/HpaI aldolase family protein [Armatimonadota bacterium]